MLHVNVTTAKAKDEMRQNRWGAEGGGNAAASFPFKIVLFVTVFFFPPLSPDFTHLEASVASWGEPPGVRRLRELAVSGFTRQSISQRWTPRRGKCACGRSCFWASVPSPGRSELGRFRAVSSHALPGGWG